MRARETKRESNTMSSNEKNKNPCDAPDDAVPQLRRCGECGHNIPVSNMALHCATCHRSRDRAAWHDADHHREQTPEEATDFSTRCEMCGKDISEMSMVVHNVTCRHRDHSRTSNVELVVDDQAIETVLENTASTTCAEPPGPFGSATNQSPPSSSSSSQQQQQQQQWSCPRCTLLNSHASNQCEACMYDRNHSQQHMTTNGSLSSLQPPDMQAVVTEVDRWVVRPGPTGSATSQSTPSSSSSQQQQQEWSCPRCTLLNSHTSHQCAACMYDRNHPQQHMTTDNCLPSLQPPNMQAEATDVDPRVVNPVGSLTTVLTRNILGGLVARPVGAPVGVATGADADGVTRITVIIRSPGGSEMMSPPDRLILQMLLLNALSQGAENANHMTFEELLLRFGVGTEHRGASPETIDALAVTKLDNEALGKLTENQKTCNICLEDFKDGQEMRTLHCLHAFHKECIDKWLLQVASCPICKQEIDADSCAVPAPEQQHQGSQQV